MKRLYKFMLTALLAAGSFTACTEDNDWSAGDPAEGMQVYFSDQNTSAYTLTNTMSSISVDILRIDPEGEADIPVAITTADPAYASLFSGPNYAYFADGQTKTQYTISFDFDALEAASTYTIDLAIDDPTLTTPYGNTSISLTLTVPEPYVLLGTGSFTEDCITTFFSAGNVTYDVEIYENTNKPGYIFLKNVYTSLYPNNDPGDYVEEDTYLSINIEDPEKVVIPEQYLGLDWGYGEFFIGTISPGTLVNGVITFPTKGLYVGMADYNDGAAYYANNNGAFRVVMPGAVLTDYSVAVAYTGRFIDTENNSFAVAEVTGGEDVEYIEVGIGAGEDANAILAGMMAGEIETIRVEGQAGSASFPIAEDGTYTIVAISYGAGEAQEAAAATFKFYTGSVPELTALEKDYTIEDLYGIEKEDLFKSWYMWGRDYFDEETTERQALAVVTFSENTADDGDNLDAINVKGLTGFVEEDTVVWEYYGGVFYNLGQSGPIGTYKGYYVGMLITDLSAGKLYNSSKYMLIGGMVDEGYMAIVSNNENYQFDGIAFPAYADAEMTSSAGNFAIYSDIMFEDPAVSSLSRAAAAAPKAAKMETALKSLAASLSVRDNFVETQRGYIRHKIDAMRARQKEARMEAAPADAVIKTFRGSVQGLYETAPKLGLSVSAEAVIAK